jgi:hypothetical protein
MPPKETPRVRIDKLLAHGQAALEALRRKDLAHAERELLAMLIHEGMQIGVSKPELQNEAPPHIEEKV